MYLYYSYQYDQPVVLNVAEEIANECVGGPLSALFPGDVRQEATRRYERIRAQTSRCLVTGKVWLGLVLVSLAVLLAGSINKRQGLVLWIPVVVILGPSGPAGLAGHGSRPK